MDKENNGFPGLVVQQSTGLFFYENHNGNLGNKQTLLDINQNYKGKINIVDMDDDGFDDITTALYNGYYSPYFLNVPGGFEVRDLRRYYYMNYDRDNYILTDMDGNNKPDFIRIMQDMIWVYPDSVIPQFPLGSGYVPYGSLVDGTLEPFPMSFPDANEDDSFTIGDIDGNGFKDFIFTSPYLVYVLYNDSNTNYTLDVLWEPYEIPPSGSITLVTPLNIQNDNSFKIKLEDLNSDGLVDVMINCFRKRKLLWLENTGSGFIEREFYFDVRSFGRTSPYSCIDLNGDGTKELIKDGGAFRGLHGIEIVPDTLFTDLKVYKNESEIIHNHNDMFIEKDVNNDGELDLVYKKREVNNYPL
ncbi:MAG: hypothetical protein R3321_10785, partial [Nitrososphaeraceae archaeon]|nr:hypothetical protein [Nitrososphaeraceae archaeon]